MSLVVGKISSWIHVDSADPFIKKNSEKVMEHVIVSLTIKYIQQLRLSVHNTFMSIYFYY